MDGPLKDYFCKPCNQTFQYKVPKSFRHHQLFHHSILRGFKCPYCKLEYVSRYPKSLLLHMASIHQVNDRMGSLQSFILKYGITDSGVEGQGSPITKAQIQSKEMAHFFVDPAQAQAGDAKKAAAMDMETRALMTGFGGLIKMVNPPVQPPFKCGQCDAKEMANYSDLLHHTAYLHSNLKGFKCDLCSKKVTFPQTLQVHLAGVHQVQHKLDGLLQFIKKYGVFAEHQQQQIAPTLPVAASVNQEPITDYKCAFCDFCAQTPAPVRNHLRAVHVV